MFSSLHPSTPGHGQARPRHPRMTVAPRNPTADGLPKSEYSFSEFPKNEYSLLSKSEYPLKSEYPDFSKNEYPEKVNIRILEK